MKVQTVNYEMSISNNGVTRLVGIGVLLGDGDSEGEAYFRAKAFVDKAFAPSVDESVLKLAKRKIAHPDDFPPKEVREAQSLIDSVEKNQLKF